MSGEAQLTVRVYYSRTASHCSLTQPSEKGLQIQNLMGKYCACERDAAQCRTASRRENLPIISINYHPRRKHLCLISRLKNIRVPLVAVLMVWAYLNVPRRWQKSRLRVLCLICCCLKWKIQSLREKDRLLLCSSWHGACWSVDLIMIVSPIIEGKGKYVTWRVK